MVEDASHNEQLQWGAPEVVKKYDCLVKPAQELDANIARIAHGVTFCFLLEDDKVEIVVLNVSMFTSPLDCL